MYRSVHKKNPIKIGEGEKLVWGKKGVCANTNLVFRGENLVYTHFSGGKSQYILIFRGKSQYILIFPGVNLSIYSFFRGGGGGGVCNTSTEYQTTKNGHVPQKTINHVNLNP